jgi:hypothetical protein
MDTLQEGSTKVQSQNLSPNSLDQGIKSERTHEEPLLAAIGRYWPLLPAL